MKQTVKHASEILFTALYRRNAALCSRHILWLLGVAEPTHRRSFYTLDRIVAALPEGSNIAECGVYKGSTILGMAHCLRMRNVKGSLWGFDSFEGLPEPTQEDALSDGTFHVQAIKGAFNDASYAAIKSKARRLGFDDRVTLVKGNFEDSLRLVRDLKFALVHVDCDLYQSYLTCLFFFYSRMVTGGYMVFDEYDYSATVYPGPKKAIDEFFRDKREKIECFPEAAVPRYFIRKQ